MVVSSGDTVVVERVDVNDLGGTIVMFNVVAIFDLSDGLITCWREARRPPTRYRPQADVRAADLLRVFQPGHALAHGRR